MMQERRKYPRTPASWTVRLWLGEDVFAIAKTADVSLHGVCVLASHDVAPFLELGQPYRVDIHPGTPEEFSCTAEVRNIINTEKELQLRMRVDEELPVVGLPHLVAANVSRD
jgi:hypothetical protein